jgi:hypothetical protein
MYAIAGNGGNKILISGLNVSVVLTATNFDNLRTDCYIDTLMNDSIVPVLLSK